jgi:hypothetical protein
VPWASAREVLRMSCIAVRGRPALERGTVLGTRRVLKVVVLYNVSAYYSVLLAKTGLRSTL